MGKEYIEEQGIEEEHTDRETRERGNSDPSIIVFIFESSEEVSLINHGLVLIKMIFCTWMSISESNSVVSEQSRKELKRVECCY